MMHVIEFDPEELDRLDYILEEEVRAWRGRAEKTQAKPMVATYEAYARDAEGLLNKVRAERQKRFT